MPLETGFSAREAVGGSRKGPKRYHLLVNAGALSVLMVLIGLAFDGLVRVEYSSNVQQKETIESISILLANNVNESVLMDKEPEKSSATSTVRIGKDDEKEETCLFRSSSLHRKIYVYPDYGSAEWQGSILSQAGRDKNRSIPWPWLERDRQARRDGTAHYHVADGQYGQYTTELLVRELLIHPQSCLRTHDPEQASLFFVPYLSSTEYRGGNHLLVHEINDPRPSPWGLALARLLENDDYQAWEDTWGLTAEYWKRKGGADHIIVFSEPLQGLWHEGNKRGDYQYIHTQKQLKPPIIISIELSKTFVEQYPRCTAKNILLPYPNPDGRWYNGYYERQIQQQVLAMNLSTVSSPAALPAERSVAENSSKARLASDFYYALPHGTCPALRKALMWNYMQCSKAAKLFSKSFSSFDFRHNMRLATFCPCPGGDSPSAKRMFDAILAGCIPIVLSHDFVWPLSKDTDASFLLDSSDFAVSLPARDYTKRVPIGSCGGGPMSNASQASSSPESIIDTLRLVDSSEIARLRRGMDAVRDSYAWYSFRQDLPDNPLREGVLPDGGLAHALVRELELRAGSQRWPDCRSELNQTRRHPAKQFKC